MCAIEFIQDAKWRKLLTRKNKCLLSKIHRSTFMVFEHIRLPVLLETFNTSFYSSYRKQLSGWFSEFIDRWGLLSDIYQLWLPHRLQQLTQHQPRNHSKWKLQSLWGSLHCPCPSFWWLRASHSTLPVKLPLTEPIPDVSTAGISATALFPQLYDAMAATLHFLSLSWVSSSCLQPSSDAIPTKLHSSLLFWGFTWRLCPYSCSKASDDRSCWSILPSDLQWSLLD